ncbi:hypothetical protein OUZ56_008674 [Daphnia magna]|uniref:Uncharacterized protein n=1 Tax=Daphnia magna TaxID=35525 RepID=A0ABQ9YWZ3_9CRUS|nr:hypothetical protein OUZ56_006737 [Daphnia magna]KAK4023253.1 hypothetical protein OUZ56_008674 [Daphnia magna]
MSLYTGTKPKIFSKPIKSTVRHGSEPFCPPLIILPLYLSLNPSLLARTIDWLRQSPSTSDFESDSEKPPRALLQGSSPQLPSSLPVVYDPKITFTIQPTATEINKVEIQEPLPSPNSSNFNFDSTLLSSLNEHQHVDTTDICEARAVINPPCQLPTAFPITCRTFTASPICTQESLTIQANFTGSRTKLSDCAIKINQQLSPTIKPETVKTIAQPIALARRNSLPSKSTVRPHTPLTAVVSNNYQNLCRSLDGLHGAYIKNQTATLKFLNEANRYTHFIKTLTPTKTQSSRKKQHPIPHGILRHLSLGLVEKICTAHSTTFINDFLQLPSLLRRLVNLAAVPDLTHQLVLNLLSHLENLADLPEAILNTVQFTAQQLKVLIKREDQRTLTTTLSSDNTVEVKAAAKASAPFSQHSRHTHNHPLAETNQNQLQINETASKFHTTPHTPPRGDLTQLQSKQSSQRHPSRNRRQQKTTSNSTENKQ